MNRVSIHGSAFQRGEMSSDRDPDPNEAYEGGADKD
jgi:hypothetical protein